MNSVMEDMHRARYGGGAQSFMPSQGIPLSQQLHVFTIQGALQIQIFWGLMEA